MDKSFVFFDSDAVKRATNAAQRQALSKFGAYCRRVARNSIKKSRTISKPGDPPHSHTGRLKNNIYFGWDERNRSVVVGPLKIAQVEPPVPNILEVGGVRQARYQKPDFHVGGVGPVRRRPSHNGKGLVYGRLTSPRMVSRANNLFMTVYGAIKPAIYRARPFMEPAFKKSLPIADDLFRNTINKRR